jgi:hypothetical protein
VRLVDLCDCGLGQVVGCFAPNNKLAAVVKFVDLLDQ